MKMSNFGLQHLMRSEGFKNEIYQDVAGYATIGVGHLLTKAELSSGKIYLSNGSVIDTRNTKISNDEVKALLADDVPKYEQCIIDHISVPLQQTQFDALVSWAFSIGCANVAKSTLAALLNQGKFDQVPDQLRRWNRTGGKVVMGLVNRREREIELWLGLHEGNRKFDRIELTTLKDDTENKQVVEMEKKPVTAVEREESAEFLQWKEQQKTQQLEKIKEQAIREWAQANTQKPTESRTIRNIAYAMVSPIVIWLVGKFGLPESYASPDVINFIIASAVTFFGSRGILFRKGATKFVTDQWK